MFRLSRSFFALVAVPLVLAGCEKVEFQSPPTWPLLQCDARLVGDWQVEDVQSAGEQGESVTYIRIADDCASWLGVEVGTGDQAGQLKVEDLQAEMQLSFARSAHHHFIVSLDLDAKSSSDQPKGYVLVRYEAVGDGFQLGLLDPEKTAHKIVDGAIDGWLEKRDRAADGSVDPYAKRFYVYVFGDPSSTSSLLDEHAEELLQPVWMRLQPVGSDVSSSISKWTANGPTKNE